MNHHKSKIITIISIFLAGSAIIATFWLFFSASSEQNWEPAKAEQTSETTSSGGTPLESVSLIDQMNGVQCLDDSTKTEIIDILEGTGVTPTDITCQEVLDSCFKKQQEQFPALTDHFLNGAATSQLYPPALDLLIQWDKESYVVVESMAFVEALDNTVDRTMEISQCRLRQSEIYDGLKSALKNLAIESANAKKTYKLVSKYKEINAHLSELTDQMGRFHGYMNKIAQRVPALSKYCQ